MVDITFTAASVLAASGATTGGGTAGATITQGDLVYLDTDNTYKLADDGAALSAAVAGIALNSASATQPIEFIKAGTLSTGTATVALGVPYMLSTTAGAMMNTATASGNMASFVAIGLTTASVKVGIVNSGVAVA